MARTDNLTNYLTDVADAIRTKTGSQSTIQASNFDTEIEDIETLNDGYVTEEISYTGGSTGKSANKEISALITKKIPYFKVKRDMSNSKEFGYMFAFYVNLEEVDVSGFDINTRSNIFKGMFYSCLKLKEIDLSSWGTIAGTNPTSTSDTIALMFKLCSSLKRADLRCFSGSWMIGELFTSCTSLEHVDLRGLDFATCGSTSNFLGTNPDVPTTCEIIVADATQKEWMATNYPTYTNVKTVAEYES